MTDGNILKCFHEIQLMLKPLLGVKENPYTLSLDVSLWLSLFLYPIFSTLEKAPLFLKVWMCSLFWFWVYSLSSSYLLSHSFPRVQFTPFLCSYWMKLMEMNCVMIPE